LSQYPSSAENNWILIDLHNNRGAMAYGIQAFRDRNPLAWSAFATAEDVAGFPPAVISVNECDPLRDEGISFYRLLMHSGVRACCRQGDGNCPRYRNLSNTLIGGAARDALDEPILSA
jgi:acetyl esterase